MLSSSEVQQIKEILFQMKESFERRFDSLENRVLNIEMTMKIRFDEIEERFKKNEARIEDINKRLMKVQDVLVGLHNYVWGELQMKLTYTDEQLRNMKDTLVIQDIRFIGIEKVLEIRNSLNKSY